MVEESLLEAMMTEVQESKGCGESEADVAEEKEVGCECRKGNVKYKYRGDVADSRV
jgi:hypothetical protein